MSVMWTGRVPAHRFASSTAVVTPANPPPTMRTRGASEVERRARTRPIGHRCIIVLETRVLVFGFAECCETCHNRSGSPAIPGSRRSGEGQRELLAEDHAGAVQPRFHRRDRLLEDGGSLFVREVLDISQDEYHTVVVRKAVDRPLQHTSPLARQQLFLGVL